MRPLWDRLAVVTGAAGRLGRAWAQALRDEGATVIGLDLPWCDITSPRELSSHVNGGVDILVNAAGIDFPPNMELRDAEMRVLDVNIRGVDVLMRTLSFNNGRASVVLVGSLYASVSPDPRIYPHPWEKPTLYGASKAAVVNLTKQWAVRLAPKGIRVNCLSPGGVRADQDEEFVRKYSERVPLGRMATVEDTVGPLLFLCSDASRYVTGIELVVDGGYTAW